MSQQAGVVAAILVLVAVMVVACGGSSAGRGDAMAQPVASAAAPEDAQVRARLEEAWRKWKGTPHRLGGTDLRGVDCSGLVQAVYRQAFGIRLPRTTAAQVRVGRPVARSQIRAGDLVFFRPAAKGRHVGIAMGDGRFLHASSRYGVQLSRLDDDFWRSCFWTARRVR